MKQTAATMEQTIHPCLNIIKFYYEIGLKMREIQSVPAKRLECHISDVARKCKKNIYIQASRVSVSSARLHVSVI